MTTQAYDTRGPSGWTEFVAVVMFGVGFFRIISAIAEFSNSRKLSDLTNGLFSNHLWGWAVWDLLVAAAAILGGLSLLDGRGFGRVLGYIFGVLVIVQSFAIIQYAPWYGAGMIALGVLVVYGVAHTPHEATS
jgi:hypothetical protein